MITISHQKRERRPERTAVAKAGDDLDAVLLELLARTAPVALLAACEIRVDRIAVELEPGRQAAQDPDQRGTVRLAPCCQPKRHEDKPTARRIASTGAATPVQSSNEAAPCATNTSSPVTTLAPSSRAARAVAVSG